MPIIAAITPEPIRLYKQKHCNLKSKKYKKYFQFIFLNKE